MKKYSAMMISLWLGLFMIEASAKEKTPLETLTIYVNESFISEWGPGQTIQKLFEQQCHCRIRYIGMQYGEALLSHILTKKEKAAGDVVLGMNGLMIASARLSGLFIPHGVTLPAEKMKIKWAESDFLPSSYGYQAWVYDHARMKHPPQSFQALLEATNLTISIEDPRTSSSGLGLLLWVKSIYGANAATVWRTLAKKTKFITKGWQESYRLLLKGEVDMMPGYTHIPSYYENKLDSYHRHRAANFREGHLLRIEFAGILRHSGHLPLAQKFMAFILSEEFQSTIAMKGWVYPVTDLDSGFPATYHKNLSPKIPFKSLSIDTDAVHAHYQEWIDEWVEAMKQPANAPYSQSEK